MNTLFSVASSLDAISTADSFGEAIGDCSRGLSAFDGGWKRIADHAQRQRFLAPSQADALRALQRRLREGEAFVSATLRQHDPQGLEGPIDTALILSSFAPASVRQAAE